MYVETFSTIDELWTHTVRNLLVNGKELDSRNGRVKEIIGYTAVLNNVHSTFLLNGRRKLSASYACAEFLWYLNSDPSVEMICAYAPSYSRFADDGIAYGAYGHRAFSNLQGRDKSNCAKYRSQYELVIDHLRTNLDSRQAVVTLWEANDLTHACAKDRKDLPCTLSLQFLIRGGELHLITTMRSNDAWLGLPYDVFAFTCIQQLVAGTLNVRCGTYTHQVGSEHLYEKNWTAAREALKCTPTFPPKTHGWHNSLQSWNKDIVAAHRLERMMRINDGCIRVELGQLRHVNTLYDAVACCSWQFGYELRPISPILQEALR